MAFFEIPTGVVADTLGRRVSFLISVVIVFAGTLAYVGAAKSGGSLLLFSAVSVLLGLGYTFYSGAVEAWLVDVLKTTGYQGELDRVFARGAMATGAAMLIGTVTGGVLGSFDLTFPFLLRAGLLVAVFGVAFSSMRDLGFERRALDLSTLPAEMRVLAHSGITHGWREKSVRLLIIVSFFQWGFLTWSFYAWQPYFLQLLDRDAVWVVGGIAALVSASTILGNAVVEWFTRFCGRRTTLLLWAAGIQAAAAIGVGCVSSFWLAVALFMVVAACMGVAGPVKQAYLHQVVPSGERATVISFGAMISGGGGALGQLGLGYLSRIHSIAHGYVAGGLVISVVVPLLGFLRGLGSPVDVIVGTAGRKGGCAAQGLPNVSSINTAPPDPAGD